MLSYLFKTILIIFGWKLLSARELQYFNSQKKKIIIYTHTSYFDFFIMCIYKFSYSELNNIKFGMSEIYYNMCEFILSRLGCIPVPDRHYEEYSWVDYDYSTYKVRWGFVKYLINTFKNKDEYSFSISPEGSLVKSNWKTGYYYITKGLKECGHDVYIIPAGLDYEQHRIFIGTFHDINRYTNKESLELSLYEEMQYMVPLHPEKSYTPSIYVTTPSVCKYDIIIWIICFIIFHCQNYVNKIEFIFICSIIFTI